MGELRSSPMGSIKPLQLDTATLEAEPMAPVTAVRKAMLVVFAFIAGEMGVLFIGLAIAHMTGTACVAIVWVPPAAAILGLVLVAAACAATFLAALHDPTDV